MIMMTHGAHIIDMVIMNPQHAGYCVDDDGDDGDDDGDYDDAADDKHLMAITPTTANVATNTTCCCGIPCCKTRT